METQKIVNLLNAIDNKKLKFATKKWYIIDSESKGNYSPNDEITFLTTSLESSFCDYSDSYILVKGNLTVTGGNANTKVAFKNCAPFKECRTEINEVFNYNSGHVNIAMVMYNMIEYSDNYSDTSGSLWQFKRDEIEGDVDLAGRKFYDQAINGLIKQYHEVRKISTGKGDDYTTGCLLDFADFLKKLTD